MGAGLSFFPTRDSSIKVNGRVISTDLGDAIYRTYQAGVEFNQDRWGTHFSLIHQGSLQDETPEFIPGSGTVTRAQLNQALHFLPISIGAFGEFNHEYDGQNIFGITLGTK